MQSERISYVIIRYPKAQMIIRWASTQQSSGINLGTLSSCLRGMMSAPARTRSRAPWKPGGSRASSWMLNIWPSFSAAPLILHRASARRAALASDTREEAVPASPPKNVREMDSVAAPRANDAPSPANPSARPSAEEGTARSRGEKTRVAEEMVGGEGG